MEEENLLVDTVGLLPINILVESVEHYLEMECTPFPLVDIANVIMILLKTKRIVLPTILNLEFVFCI